MKAHAKLNLALAVGPMLDEYRHEIASLMIKLDLADEVTLEPADDLTVTGFEADTIVRRALQQLTPDPLWHVHIEKRIPVAAGLGGGSSDAATALQLAAPGADLHDVAARVGSDVPFFLRKGPQLAIGAGDELRGVELALDFHVVLLLPHDARKESTGAVYAAFTGHDGFEERRARVLAAKLDDLPPNDLASSPHARELERLGAFRADVTGAGPTVYGLFRDEHDARRVAAALDHAGRVWVTKPAW